MPSWDNFSLALYFAFTFLFTGNFMLHDASPEIVNGNYAFRAHGFYRTVTKAEFLRFRVYEARMNASHWMGLCSLIVWELYNVLLRK